MKADPATVHQINVTMMPKPRKSRHPYQWACMGLLLTYAVLNLAVGPAENSPLLNLAGPHAHYLNWTLLFGSAFCLVAMVVPDNWWRMVIEFAGHAWLLFTMAAYGYVSYSARVQQLTPADSKGLSLNIIFAFFTGVAAFVRCIQIANTMYRIWFNPHAPDISTTVSDAELGNLQ